MNARHLCSYNRMASHLLNLGVQFLPENVLELDFCVLKLIVLGTLQIIGCVSICLRPGFASGQYVPEGCYLEAAFAVSAAGRQKSEIRDERQCSL